MGASMRHLLLTLSALTLGVVIVNRIFRCRHTDYTKPITLIRGGQMCVTCHQCKQRLPYDWKQMKVIA